MRRSTLCPIVRGTIVDERRRQVKALVVLKTLLISGFDPEAPKAECQLSIVPFPAEG
jgi:hypothetical protein